jgi:hypothetical protein
MELLESVGPRPRQARYDLTQSRKGNCLLVLNQLYATKITKMKRRFAICAAKLGPKPASSSRPQVREPQKNPRVREKRGSFEGAIRIPLRSPSFLFNDLVFLGIPRKSLKFRQLLFSISTAHCGLSQSRYSP